MSEGDFYEALAAWAGNGVASFTVFISFTFAYLTACYFIGKRLSRTQAVTLSVLYLISATSASVSNLSSFDAMRIIMNNHPSDFDHSLFFNIEMWMAGMVFINLSVMFSSIYFLVHLRQDDA